MPLPLVWAFAAFACGVLVSEAGAAPHVAWLALVVVVLGVAGIALRRGRGVAIAALGLWLGLGGLSASLREPPGKAPALCGSDSALVRARVVAPVQRRMSANGDRLTQQTRLVLEAAQCGDAWVPATGRIDAGLWGDMLVRRDDQIMLRLRLGDIARAHNPVGFDPLQRARQEGLTAQAHVLSPHVLLRGGRGVGSWLDARRAEVAQFFERAYPTPVAALAKALALGDQASVAANQREVWADAGLAHLLAVSGLQVTFVALLTLWLARWLLSLVPGAGERFSARRAGAVIAALAVIAYCLWVGGAPPIARAGIMAVAGFAAIALGRSAGAALNALALAGLVLLVLDPLSLYDVSFLLSFVAVAALLLVPRRRHGWRWWLLTSLVATVVATLATAPVTAYAFGRVSLVAPLTNLLAVPLANVLATPLALLLAFAVKVAPSAADLLAQPFHWVLELLDGLAAWGAGLSWAAVDVPRPGVPEWVFYVGLLLTLLLGRRWRRLTVAAGIGLGLAIGARTIAARGDGQLRVLHPYVGQGGAAVVQLPQGGTLLFDAGGAIEPDGFDPGRRVVAPLLRTLGVRHLDIAVISHPHPDHLNGMVYVSQHFPIGELWWNGEGEDLPAMQTVMAAVRARGGRTVVASALPREQWREGVRFRIPHPRGPDAGVYPELSTNDNSVVLELTYRDQRLLLAGDIEETSESLVAPMLESAAVMRAPHHGSRSSSSEFLLQSVQPRVAIISCGVDNHFGFPHQEVLERYERHRVVVLRTDQDGMITQTTTEQGWVIDTHRSQVHLSVNTRRGETPRNH